MTWRDLLGLVGVVLVVVGAFTADDRGHGVGFVVACVGAVTIIVATALEIRYRGEEERRGPPPP